MKIEQIELYISNYDKTVWFYKNVLEFNCHSESKNTIHFKVGKSILTLHRNEKESYYYHFAFNIPPNLFQSAKEWMRKRVSLAIDEGLDEADFEDSNANAFYFEDPAGNIVEYIARRNTTPNAGTEQFAPIYVRGISEIGISTNNIKEIVDGICSLGISSRKNEPIYYETYLNFLGEDKDGQYIIVGPLGRRWIFSNKVGIHAPVIIKTDCGTIRNF